MTDVSSATLDAPPTTPPTPTTPLPNSPEARTPDGTLKDAQTQTPPTTPEPNAPKDPAEKPTPPAVPEKYDFKDTDAKVAEKATPIFKELGLSQDAAQKLVDLYNAQAAETTKLVADMRADWRTQTNALPEVATNPRAVEDMGRAKAVIFENDPKGLAEFNEAMDLTGAGDHPAVVKAMLRFASRVNEGSHVSGRGPSSEGQASPNKVARPSAAQSLYPNLPSASH